MLTLSVAITFFYMSLLLAYAPGPDILFVLSQSVLYGAKSGLATTLGLMTGLCFHTALVALGIAALIKASPLAFTLIKVAGACYLLWLAWLSWRATAMTTTADGEQHVAQKPSLLALYRRGILMNITNPKVTLFFLALLPQFCDPARGSVALQCISLGLIFMLATAVGFSSVALLSGHIAKRFTSSAKSQILLHKACALVFVALAGMLLFSSI